MLTRFPNRSALDFNPINTIASHLQYWQDEDVIHFIVSQLLSRKSDSRATAASGAAAATPKSTKSADQSHPGSLRSNPITLD